MTKARQTQQWATRRGRGGDGEIIAKLATVLECVPAELRGSPTERTYSGPAYPWEPQTDRDAAALGRLQYARGDGKSVSVSQPRRPPATEGITPPLTGEPRRYLEIDTPSLPLYNTPVRP